MHSGCSTTDVLVAGAGPVGLTAAIELARRGIDCRIVDRRPTPRPGTRGCTVWQRTLEVFGLMGLPLERYLDQGVRYVYRTYHLTGFPPLTHDMSEPESPSPHPLIIGQDETERMLTAHLAGLGVTVERGWTVVSAEQDEDGVTARLAGTDGDTRQIRAGWVVAAQGPHSSLRDQLGVRWQSKRFPGTQLLQVDAHVRGGMPGDPSHCHLFMSEAGSLGTAPLPDGRRRLYAGVPDTDPHRAGDPTLDELEAAVRAVTGVADLTLHEGRFNWRVRLHNSLATPFRAGRCLLAGDTAHTVMPVTAQGMNTGIQDAFNLGWKLAAVVAGQAPSALLDSYEDERRPVAQSLVERTERAFWGGTGPMPALDQLYDRLHHIGSVHTGLPLSYPDSPLSEQRGDAGGPQAGDRAPDAPLWSPEHGPTRLYRLLREGGWTLLAFPEDPAEPSSVEQTAKRMAGLDRATGVVRRLVTLTPGASTGVADVDGALRRTYGAGDGGLFLIRPDGYLGFRAPAQDTDALDRYLGRVLGQPAGQPPPPAPVEPASSSH
jgi:2-polyprenyl-6-methoxyphenol hydroxylase-like FAD-dependent oxidoreductase